MVSVTALRPVLRLCLPRTLLQQTALKPYKNTHFSTVAFVKKRGSLHGNVLENSRKMSQSVAAVSSRHGSTGIKSQGDTFLVIENGDKDLEIPYIWLRDHCRCNACYNHTTLQKNADTYSLSAEIAPKNVQMVENGKKIQIVWPDGHRSSYEVDWLVEHSFSTTSKTKTPMLLWDKKTMTSEHLPVVSYDDYRDSSEKGVKETLRNLLKYGFSILEGVEDSIRETQVAVERIAYLHQTIFGQMWSFTSDLQRSDSAYTNVSLGPHTDTTYYYQPTGIQVFHCLWHDGKGGDSLLVDGFHAAELFKKDHPEDFDFLTRAMVPHEFKECDKHHMLSHGPTLRVHPGSEELIYIRFNPYDMAPLDTIAPQDIVQFYTAYNTLASYLRDPAAGFWLKLHPGMVLLVNNWRVLHGRASFSGRRVICGCYLPRDDWMNKARVYGLV